jgi:hypothetical protein
MVVINYSADATRIDRETVTSDGSPNKRVSSTVSEPATLDVTIELPDGHVNLDAYSYALAPDNVAERIQYDHPPAGIEVDTRTITCDISGTPREWITAAQTWLTERTDPDVREALHRFGEWGDTGDGPDRAIELIDAGEVDL